jgi:hypothetical protein
MWPSTTAYVSLTDWTGLRHTRYGIGSSEMLERLFLSGRCFPTCVWVDCWILSIVSYFTVLESFSYLSPAFTMSPSFQKLRFDTLPAEALHGVLTLLPPWEIKQLSFTSKRLRKVTLPFLFRHVEFQFSQADSRISGASWSQMFVTI